MVTEPLGYLDFINLEMGARVVLTDSGGMQIETTWLGIPCLTLRENTERPITISQGTNRLVRLDTESIIEATMQVLEGKEMKVNMPRYWDGETAGRMSEVIMRWLQRGG